MVSAALTTHHAERDLRYNTKKCFLSNISVLLVFCVSLFTHFSPMSHFYTPWKRFQEVSKCDTGLKWVKGTHYYFVRFVPESVRWLRSKNKLIKAENILRKIASSNNKEYPSNIQLQPVKSSEVHSGSFKDLVSNFHIASMTLRLCIMWLVYLTSFKFVFSYLFIHLFYIVFN